MGDISELRGLAVVISFLGILILLINYIPPQFYVESYEGRTVVVPDEFGAENMIAIAYNWTLTLDDSGSLQYYPLSPPLNGWFYYYIIQDIGGHNLALFDRQASRELVVYHYWSGQQISLIHRFDWANMETGENRGVSLTDSEIDVDYNQESMKYRLTCAQNDLRLVALFAFNETLYSLPSDAWDANALKVLIGVEFDQVLTTMNAWGLIGMLLFFQLPGIHPIINAIIALPLWICIAYISFILILRTIGAIFGGGA